MTDTYESAGKRPTAEAMVEPERPSDSFQCKVCFAERPLERHTEFCLNGEKKPPESSDSVRDRLATEHGTHKNKWSQSGERFTAEEHAQGIGLSLSPNAIKSFKKGWDAALAWERKRK